MDPWLRELAHILAAVAVEEALARAAGQEVTALAPPHLATAAELPAPHGATESTCLGQRPILGVVGQ